MVINNTYKMIDTLVKWSEKWQMLLNFGKCKCINTGHGNLDINYSMGDTVLGITVKVKHLGITTRPQHTVHKHGYHIARRI